MNKKLLAVLTASLFSLSALSAQAVTVTLDQQQTEVKQQMEQIKKLPQEQRKQKMEELKNKYPDVFKNKKMKRGKDDKGNKQGKYNHKKGFANLDKLSAKYPQLTNEINQIKQLPKEQQKQRLKELKTKYPDIFKKGQYEGKNNFNRLNELAKTNTQLATELNNIKNLSKDQRRTKMKELYQKYLK